MSISRRTFLGLGAGLGLAAVTDGLAPVARAAAARAYAAPLFDDRGTISSGLHHLPTIAHVAGSTVTIAVQARLAGSPATHVDKGASHIVTFRSTDGGATWGPARYVYQSAGPEGDCGYSPVLTVVDGRLSILYTVGPQDWETADLVVHQRFSDDGGDTWGPVSLPSVTSAHVNGLPTNGGRGFQFPNGRVVVPGRSCLLYSDDGGATWTATPEFGETVELKTVPYFIDGAVSRTALVPWRTSSTTTGRIGRIRIADFYSNNATITHPFGAQYNLGFSRYDAQTVLQSGTRANQLYVRKSVDEGVTWTHEQLVTGSAPTARYSDIAVTGDGTVVVVFMQNPASGAPGAPLNVVRFTLDWLESGVPA